MEYDQEFREFLQIYRFPVLSGRPNRLDPISRDDVLNLQIALALSKDVLDFIEDHHIFNA
jgi:hypothetical protein